jgi:2-polyprenyl-3-methyl-5-hydroxy-6-metoxy-1,4-benzoquinol methylase
VRVAESSVGRPGSVLGPAPTPRELRARFPEDGYLAFHAPRYGVLLEALDRFVTVTSTVLDIGGSRLTQLMHERYGVSVDTLGFVGDEATETGRSWWFDLNLAAHRERWRTDLPQYDVIVMAEVIEHLYVAPSYALGFLRTLLHPGGRLVIQTPNAVAFHKRVEMLVGRHPYEPIREQLNDPGHFREYTKSELIAAMRAAGYRVEDWRAARYLDYRYVHHDRPPQRISGTIMNAVYRLMPPSLQPGQMLVAAL